MPTRHCLSSLKLFMALLVLAGCTTTGRGDSPTYSPANSASRTLAVLPPFGAGSEELHSSVLFHLDRQGLASRFGKLKIVSRARLKEVLDDQPDLDSPSDLNPAEWRERTGADLLLTLDVESFSIERFTTTETQTLYSSQSRHRDTTVHSEQSDRDLEVQSQETRTSYREVPVSEGNLRVVLALTARLYDLGTGSVVWEGRRIERAEDELEDLSLVELKDIVVERVMYRINNRLGNGGTS